MLVTVPVAAIIAIATPGSGDLQLAWLDWPTLPSATTLVFQGAFNDAAAVKGVSLSNGLLAVTP